MSVKDIRTLKNDLRSQYKKTRANLDPKIKRKTDFEIQSRLFSLNQYSEADVIFTYVSTKIEIDTTRIIESAIASKKKVAVPRCNPGELSMDFYYINSLSDLESGTFGVLEPKPETCEKVTDFSKGLCIVPGLSFDSQGYRLGYGKGYYDRFLSRYTGITVGLCYVSCIKWQLPHGYYDKTVDILITERYIRNIESREDEK
ncbi:MAG: 5-formyltetrahydrofolate cyclo-ligase [Bacillota bacterium]|nr:5-formyltetrahydrofolate cyclo-ligase [Bacillota bacterium]